MNTPKGEDRIDELKAVHLRMKKYLDSQSWEKAREYMKEMGQTGDVNKMKMILILTQSLIEHPEISESRYKLYQRFNAELGWDFRNWPLLKKNDHNVPIKFKNAKP